MRTQFTQDQLADPALARSEQILRKCVHCGFCNATCPTYMLLGDELDSPRGRIYQIRDMLEQGGAPDPDTVTHIDRCLSCLGCMTTCPSGVDYMHLVDHARSHIAAHHKRPWRIKGTRKLLRLLTDKEPLFRLTVGLGRLVRPLAPMLPPPLQRMLRVAGKGAIVSPAPPRGCFRAEGETRLRVVLLSGCVQPALAPDINAATIRILNRFGVDVIIPEAAGCCGALSHHLGEVEAGKAQAAANIAAWRAAATQYGPIDHIVTNISGCGSHIGDYGDLFANDPNCARDATETAASSIDIADLLARLPLEQRTATLPALNVAYHAPCSLQHGQQRKGAAETLLQEMGFSVLLPRESHVCCGAAGSYTLLQPELSDRLRARKQEHLRALTPDVIATGNVGCQTHLADGLHLPVLHIVQLLDWASGGPRPPELARPPANQPMHEKGPQA
jgi:glycolate oxidase iron-sulfur subunit